MAVVGPCLVGEADREQVAVAQPRPGRPRGACSGTRTMSSTWQTKSPRAVAATCSHGPCQASPPAWISQRLDADVAVDEARHHQQHVAVAAGRQVDEAQSAPVVAVAEVLGVPRGHDQPRPVHVLGVRRVGGRGDALRPPLRRTPVRAVPGERAARLQPGRPGAAAAAVEVVEHGAEADPAADPRRRARRSPRRSRRCGAGGRRRSDRACGYVRRVTAEPSPTSVVGAAIVAAAGCSRRAVPRRRRRPAGGSSRAARSSRGRRPEQALVREIAEELGCTIEVTGWLRRRGRRSARPHLLTVASPRLVAGEPVPHEHDRCAGSAADELDDVDWLEPDRPFLPELRAGWDDGPVRGIFFDEDDAQAVVARLPPTATTPASGASAWPARTTTRTTPGRC